MSISNHQISIIFVLGGGGGGGGVQAYDFGKFVFEIWAEEKGHVRLLLGLFWVRVHNLAYVRPRSKFMGPNTKTTPKEIELLKCHHSICLKKTRLFIKRMSQSDEKLPSYANYKVAR